MASIGTRTSVSLRIEFVNFLLLSWSGLVLESKLHVFGSRDGLDVGANVVGKNVGVSES